MKKRRYKYAFMGRDVNHEKHLTEEWGEKGWRFTGYARQVPSGTEYLMEKVS